VVVVVDDDDHHRHHRDNHDDIKFKDQISIFMWTYTLSGGYMFLRASSFMFRKMVMGMTLNSLVCLIIFVVFDTLFSSCCLKLFAVFCQNKAELISDIAWLTCIAM